MLAKPRKQSPDCFFLAFTFGNFFGNNSELFWNIVHLS